VKIKKVLVTAALAVAAFGANAQLVTFDPVNWASNFITALKAVSGEIAAMKAEYDRAQMIYQQVKQNKAMLNSVGLTAASKNVNAWQKAMDASALVQSQLGANQDFVKNVALMQKASGKTWQDFLAEQAKLAAMNDKRASERSKQAGQLMQELQASMAERQAVVAQLPSAEGPTQAIQQNSALLNNLAATNEKILMALSARQADASIEIAKENGKAAERAENEAKYQADLEARNQVIKNGAYAQIK
jgi:hypothetical protein